MGNMEYSPEVLSAIREVILASVEDTQNKRIEAFRALNKEAEKNGIVFAGDSMIERFPVSEMFRKKAYIYNRGIDGIETGDLLAHLDEHILQLKPSKLFILIGSNDIGVGSQPQEIVDRLKDICKKVCEQLKEVKIHIISVCPINMAIQSKNNLLGRTRSNEIIIELNRLIESEIIQSSNYVYLNVYPHLTGEDGELRTDYTVDGLHLSIDGYKKVREVIEKYI